MFLTGYESIVKKGKNMKTTIKTFFFVLILQAIVTDCYAESYRVRGEVYETGQNIWTRTLGSKIIPEVPVIIEQSGKIVSFVFSFEPPPSKKYTVTDSLSTNQNLQMVLALHY